MYSTAEYLAGLLKRLVGQQEYHIKNSEEIAGFIGSICVALDDILVGLDIRFLYLQERP